MTACERRSAPVSIDASFVWVDGLTTPEVVGVRAKVARRPTAGLIAAMNAWKPPSQR